MHPTEENCRTANHLFPVFLKLENLRVLLIGGGNVGVEKLSAIMKNAPLTKVTVIAKEIDDRILQMQRRYSIEIIQKEYEYTDLEGYNIVFAAVNDLQLSAQLAQDCRQQRLLVNVADKPDMCDFYLSSVAAKGSLKIAVSTNGKSPTFAKRLKAILEDAIPDETECALDNLEAIRNKIHGNFTEKVHTLHQATSSLSLHNGLPGSQQSVSEIKWKKIAWLSLGAFFFMIFGYIIISLIPLKEIGVLASTLDKTFYWMIAIGFVAQMVDGALGMGYGVTSTAALLSVGVPLPAISGSIHTAEMFSSGASGFSHYKFGNINKKLLRTLIIPGVAGSIAGAVLLSVLGIKHADYIRPLLAVYTMLLGSRILYNAFKKRRRSKKVKRAGWLALSGGFLDSFGGGGWGPLVTSTLISKGKTPRYVIGTVSLAEFFVTFASALTFFSFLGLSHWQVILGLILGGILAAPIAARLAGKLPVKTMFIGVGLLVIIWSLNILLKSFWG
ncbi:TSUP family transporter [Haoranjiania flava]|uniref:Probable membrane transporter protein n=1 Tax=Haoranjiania flava TaxID=1856322 RepID=A0AAE3INI9_9BACT|nr:TSUP family transporter [Haoranjiania flava]MCU7695169.1 TSUP family transporter [Haoranjiania flava]